MRILFLTPFSALSSTSGTEARSAAFLTALKNISSVDVVHINQYETIKQDLRYQENGITIAQVQTPPENLLSRYNSSIQITRKIEALLNRRMEDYSCIVGRYIYGCSKIVTPKNVSIIADLDDIKWRSSPPDIRSNLQSLTIKRLKRKIIEYKEISKIQMLSGSFVLAERDRKYSAKIPTKVLPTPILNPPKYLPSDFTKINPKALRFLFVGTLSWEPNYQGLIWFLEACWAKFCESHPDATISIVGKVSPDQISELSSYNNVICKGFVDDLSKEYKECEFVIAPVFSGGGALVKIAEAAFYGRPILTTPFAAAGYKGILEAGKDIIVFDNAEDFESSIVFIEKNKERYNSLIHEARSKAESFLSFDYFSREVRGLIELLSPS